MKINEYIEVAAGGVAPDPFTGYNLLLEFQTNSNSGTTFDPTITASSGAYAWDLGDGTIIFSDKAISHTYADATTKTCKLYGKGTCNILTVDFNSDNLVGAFDLSDSAFAPMTNLNLAVNSNLTSLIMPSVLTGTWTGLQLNMTGITGILDLSMMNIFSSNAVIVITNILSLTGITFASSITGTISTLQIFTTGITGALNLSMFTSFTTSGIIQVYSNPSITGLTFASTITGTIRDLIFNSNNISGTFDLSMFSSFTTSATLQLQSNTSMTGVTFASAITGTINQLYIYNTGIVGTLDLSKFTTFSATASLIVATSLSLTGITFASSITGTFAVISFYALGITGTFDLSKFSSFTATAQINIYSMASMTGVTFASTITGTFSQLLIYSTAITGTLNISKFTTFTATAVVYLYSNPSMTAITFPAAPITGFMRTLYIHSCTALGYVNFTNLKTGVNSLNWQINSNGWTAAIVNQVLSIINGISTSGFTGRIINIGGSNSDPDTTSGGFDGVAARSALQVKTFTVTIT